jgi:hypothetical protein
MKYLFIAILALSISCGSDDKDPEPGPKYTSLAGDWVYTFPTTKLKVAFTLTLNGGQYSVTKSTVSYGSKDHTAHTVNFDNFVLDKSLGSITIEKVASGSDVSDYDIAIKDITPEKSFTEIKVSYIYQINEINFERADNAVIGRVN